MSAAEQLRAELVDRVAPLGVLVGPPATVEWPSDIAQAADGLALLLTQDDDDQAQAGAAVDVMAALWPVGDPPGDWWTTPLGQAVARGQPQGSTVAVTQSVAAAMLGVTRGTVAQLVHRGTLDRGPDGGVLVTSIVAYRA